MRIVFHAGAHCTDDERLLRSLARNRTALAAAGVAVPAPSRYRALLRETAVRLGGQPAPPETEAGVLAQILDGAHPARAVFSWDNFLSFPNWALKGALYPAAAERMQAFTRVFPRHEVSLMLALRNPVTLVAGLVAKQPDLSPEAVLGDLDPARLSWAAVIARIMARLPDLPVTVWCDEDAPLIWPEVLAAVAGDPGIELDGGDAAIEAVMRPEGFQRYRSYIADKGHLPPARRRKAALAFLEKFADVTLMQSEVDLPGWSAATVADVTARYHLDCARIAAMPGVRMIAP